MDQFSSEFKQRLSEQRNDLKLKIEDARDSAALDSVIELDNLHYGKCKEYGIPILNICKPNITSPSINIQAIMCYDCIENTIHIAKDHLTHPFYLTLAHELTHTLNHRQLGGQEFKARLLNVETNLYGGENPKSTTYPLRLRDVRKYSEGLNESLIMMKNKMDSQFINEASSIFVQDVLKLDLPILNNIINTGTAQNTPIESIIEKCNDLNNDIIKAADHLWEIVEENLEGENQYFIVRDIISIRVRMIER
jgi:hypothetical protein